MAAAGMDMDMDMGTWDMDMDMGRGEGTCARGAGPPRRLRGGEERRGAVGGAGIDPRARLAHERHAAVRAREGGGVERRRAGVACASEAGLRDLEVCAWRGEGREGPGPAAPPAIGCSSSAPAASRTAAHSG